MVSNRKNNKLKKYKCYVYVENYVYRYEVIATNTLAATRIVYKHANKALKKYGGSYASFMVGTED